MNLAKAFPTLSKPAPGWLTWSLIAVLLFVAAAFYVRSRDIERELRTEHLFSRVKVCDRVRNGDQLALIELAGLLAAGKNQHFLMDTVADSVEGISKVGDPQEIARFIVTIFPKLKFDPAQKKFCWANLAVRETPIPSEAP